MVNTFSKGDYESSDGFLTAVFGPLCWNFLHIISFNYPLNPTNEQKKHYKDYLLALGNVLPCKYCRDNFHKNLKVTGMTDAVFKSRDSFSRFIYKFHNTVNKMLNKPVFENFSFVRDRYEMFRARCVNETPLLPRKMENGCLTPLYGMRSKAIICIVPITSKKDGFQIDKRCLVRRKTPTKKRSKSKSKK